MRNVFLVLILMGCSTVYVQPSFVPATAPDGARTFSYTVQNKGIVGVPLAKMEQLRMEDIAQHVAYARWCEQGYTVSEPEELKGFLTYEGRCN